MYDKESKHQAFHREGRHLASKELNYYKWVAKNSRHVHGVANSQEWTANFWY